MVTWNQLTKNVRKSKKKKYSKPALKSKCMRQGMCLKIYTTKPKKPNSANRKLVKVLLKFDHRRFLTKRRSVLASIPGIGHNLQKFSTVLIRGGRCRDVPGVKYKLVRNKFDFSYWQKIVRHKSRSKHSIPDWDRKKLKLEKLEELRKNGLVAKTRKQKKKQRRKQKKPL